MINSLKNLSTRFARDEDGIALTEYLILLGLLTGAVIAAVILFGINLGDQWERWATWVSDSDLEPDAITPPTAGTNPNP